MSSSPSSEKETNLEAFESGEESPSLEELDDEEEYEDSDHESEIFVSLCNLKSEEELCDFVIEIEGEETPVHRTVLIANSKYYEAMLTHDTAEKKNGRVEIHGVELHAGRQCVNYMYTGEVEFSVENPENLIYAAELMQLPSLTDMYFEFLREKLSVQNCLKYVQLAETFNRRSFAGFFKKFSAENFSEFLASTDFVSMNQSLLEQCLEAVSDSGVNLESTKWEAILKWIKEDTENRKKSFPELFELIKVEKIPTEYLRENIASDDLLNEFDECLTEVFDALCLVGDSAEIYAGPIIVCHNQSRLLHQYDRQTKQWSRLTRIPTAIFYEHLDAVTRKGEVFLGTGDILATYSNKKWTKVVQIKEIESSASPTTGPRQSTYCRCAVVQNYIYMVTESSVTRYNTENGTSESTEANLGFSSGFSVTASERYLYAIGGYGNAAKEFDLLTNAWEPISNTCSNRTNGAAVFFRGHLFAIGGTDGGRNLEIYEPTTDTWSVLPGVQSSMDSFKAFVIGEKVFVVGKNNQVTTLQLPDSEALKKCTKIKFEATFSCSSCMGKAM